MNKIEVTRKTKETDITVSLCVEGGKIEINSGVGFFDHMLTAFAKHSGIGLLVKCKGDLEVDCHHTIEDIGIVLGAAFKQSIEGRNTVRYGSAYIPMDEALALAVVDLSGRPFMVFNGDFDFFKVGDMDTQMIEEFLRAFAMNAGITIHVNIMYGKNDHHKAEAVFKALAHAIKIALCENKENAPLSTKGVL